MDNLNKFLSGKNTYLTEKEAQKAAKLGMHLRKNSLKLLWYKCNYCYNFHLTSKLKK